MRLTIIVANELTSSQRGRGLLSRVALRLTARFLRRIDLVPARRKYCVANARAAETVAETHVEAAVMLAMCLAGILVCWWAEAKGNPIHQQLGVAVADGNMEGKEVRFGIFDSALFATVTTDASCGAVNAMHDSFTPLGGLVPLFNIQTGEVIFGGVGAGLYGMMIFIVLEGLVVKE